jgi:flap endonuclease-1
MGLSIRDIIPRNEFEISELKGKIICVDAFNTLYQFLSSVRQMDGTPLQDEEGRITSHLSGILYRNVALLSQGVKLVYVFDGKAPDLKAKTHKKRKEVKEQAKENYEVAKQEEDIAAMRKYSSQLVRLDDDMVRESKELLIAMGIAVVQAPSEGEAEASYLAKTKDEVYAVASQDYDSLLFGAPYLIQNLTLARKRKTPSGYVDVSTLLIKLEDVLEKLEINLDQLICLGILVGTDYNPKGIFRVGQKKALEIVKEFKTPEKIFESVKDKIEEMEEEDQFDWEVVFDLFKNHESLDVEFEFGEVDSEKIKEILVSRHGFSEERIDNQIVKLDKLREDKKQTGLGEFF